MAELEPRPGTENLSPEDRAFVEEIIDIALKQTDEKPETPQPKVDETGRDIRYSFRELGKK